MSWVNNAIFINCILYNNSIQHIFVRGIVGNNNTKRVCVNIIQ